MDEDTLNLMGMDTATLMRRVEEACYPWTAEYTPSRPTPRRFYRKRRPRYMQRK